jgi:hypothetical protein
MNHNLIHEMIDRQTFLPFDLHLFSVAVDKLDIVCVYIRYRNIAPATCNVQLMVIHIL